MSEAPDSATPFKPCSPAPSTEDAPHRRRRRAIWAAAALIFCGAGYLLSQRAIPQGSGRGGRRAGGGAVPVSVSRVTRGNIGVYINALGTVTPVYTVTVTSRVVGELMEVHYREGQIVRKGDLLAVVDPRPYQAVLTQAQGQLARDQALLKNAFIDLDRYKAVYAQHAIPEQQLATQQATVEQDQGIVKVDQGSLDAAQVNMEYTRITSPINGRVGLRTVDPGNIVQANGTTGIATITQLQPITVIFTMAEDYIYDVTSQMRAGHSLRVDALDRAAQTELGRGTVLTVDNQIDTTTGTVKVRASFPNADYRLFPNEFVNARLLVKTLMNVNLIPTAAIQRNNDVAFVYVVAPNQTVQSHNVTIATTSGNIAAVTGVNAGDTLVTDGFDRLQDGMHVSIRKEPAEQPSDAATAAGTAGPERAPANNPNRGQAQQGAANTQINAQHPARQQGKSR